MGDDDINDGFTPTFRPDPFVLVGSYAEPRSLLDLLNSPHERMGIKGEPYYSPNPLGRWEAANALSSSPEFADISDDDPGGVGPIEAIEDRAHDTETPYPVLDVVRSNPTPDQGPLRPRTGWFQGGDVRVDEKWLWGPWLGNTDETTYDATGSSASGRPFAVRWEPMPAHAAQGAAEVDFYEQAARDELDAQDPCGARWSSTWTRVPSAVRTV